MDETTMRVREAELGFLRWGWWVFPAAGVAAAMLTGGGFWAWVAGGTPWLDWRQAFTWRAAALAGAGMALAGTWRVLLGRKWPGWVVALVVAAGFAGAECAVRIPAAQTAFWLAAEARIPAIANMSFQHDVCHVRLETAAKQQDSTPAVVLVGSSQVVEGVDAHLLSQLLPDWRVIKRAVSSLRPLQALAAQKFIPVREGDVVVHYLSEFDFTNQEEFPYAWFRPFGSWSGWMGVASATGWTCLLQNWRGSFDFALAATLETWRQRDWFRTGFFRIWGVSPDELVFDGTIPLNRNGAWFAASSRQDDAFGFDRWQERAMEEWVAHVDGAGASMVIFEGQVNPDLRTQNRHEAHEKTVAWLESFAMRGLPVQHVHLDDEFPVENWKDHTHLNALGREKLTQAIGRVLLERMGRE